MVTDQQSKLTLSIDKNTIEDGKKYARQTGRTLSSIVSNYLQALTQAEQAESKLSQQVTALIGIAKGSTTERDYRRHIEDKYS